jgi:hypothetical protein
MQVAIALAYKALTAAQVMPVALRAKNGDLLGVYATQAEAEAAQTAKSQTVGLFEPTDAEAAELATLFPAPAPKADPMADRLKKSEREKPVAFVLRYCLANPDMDRKTQIANLVEMGIATYTARTQVQVGRRRVADLRALQAAQVAEQGEAEQEEGGEVNQE